MHLRKETNASRFNDEFDLNVHCFRRRGKINFDLPAPPLSDIIRQKGKAKHLKIPENRLFQASDLQQLGTSYQLNPTETEGKCFFFFLNFCF